VVRGGEEGSQGQVSGRSAVIWDRGRCSRERASEWEVAWHRGRCARWTSNGWSGPRPRPASPSWVVSVLGAASGE